MESLPAIVWQLLIGMVVLLTGATSFFVIRLITKVDENTHVTSEFAKELSALRVQVSSISEISQRMLSVEKQIAVFEYILKNRGSHDTSSKA